MKMKLQPGGSKEEQDGRHRAGGQSSGSVVLSIRFTRLAEPGSKNFQEQEVIMGTVPGSLAAAR